MVFHYSNNLLILNLWQGTSDYWNTNCSLFSTTGTFNWTSKTFKPYTLLSPTSNHTPLAVKSLKNIIFIIDFLFKKIKNLFLPICRVGSFLGSTLHLNLMLAFSTHSKSLRCSMKTGMPKSRAWSWSDGIEPLGASSRRIFSMAPGLSGVAASQGFSNKHFQTGFSHNGQKIKNGLQRTSTC